MKDKAYIMTTPCSGKTTFIGSHENEYKMLHLFDERTEFLPPHSCILGMSHKPDQEKYIYAIVLIDKEFLRAFSIKRKMIDPDNAWTEELVFSHSTQGYHAIQRAAKEYNIPVFKTFEEALDFVIVKMTENEEE